jgi:hypothetical protein
LSNLFIAMLKFRDDAPALSSNLALSDSLRSAAFLCACLVWRLTSAAACPSERMAVK